MPCAPIKIIGKSIKETWNISNDTTMNYRHLAVISSIILTVDPYSLPWPTLDYIFSSSVYNFVVLMVCDISCYFNPRIVKNRRYTDLFGDVYYTGESCHSCVVMTTIDPVLFTADGILHRFTLNMAKNDKCKHILLHIVNVMSDYPKWYA